MQMYSVVLTSTLSVSSQDVARMSAFTRSILPAECTATEQDIADLYYRERCNCFGIWDEDDNCLASAIFPIASFFNHSCVPNCTRFPDVTGCISVRFFDDDDDYAAFNPC